MRVAGVDGTKGGWVAIVLEAGRFAGDRVIRPVEAALEELDSVQIIAVDVPIGFGPRKADRAARAFLSGAASTVFTTPSRAAQVPEAPVGCTNSVVGAVGCERSVGGQPGSVGRSLPWRLSVLVLFVYLFVRRLFALVLLLARSDASKELELLVLRHELSILRRQKRRPQLTGSDRLLLAALSRVVPRRSWHAFLITPETLRRWHRRIVARRWTYPRRRRGRPPIDQEVRKLILRLARENSHWGYVRIVGELRKLGITVSATLVRNVLPRAGVPLAARSAGSRRGRPDCRRSSASS